MGARIPTGADDLRLMARTVRLVVSVPVYAFIGIVAGFVAVTGFVLTQNLSLVTDTVIGSSLPVSNRLVILSEIYPFVGNFYSTPAAVAMSVLAVLVGVNIALVTYHFREHEVSASGSGGSVMGIGLGVLGAGCAACGSALLFGLLSLFGAGSLVFLLPFDGLEVTVLAATALLLSTYWIAEGMRGGKVEGCPIDI